MNENENLKASDADEDLEDGEIESDDENEVNSSRTNDASDKKGNISDKNKTISSEDACSPEKLLKNKSGKSPSSFEHGGEKKSKKLAHSFDEDDFAGNIENAIAAVLKKDGIEPLPLPKIEKRYDGYDSPFPEEQQQQQQTTTRHKGKKRKRRDNDDVKKKKKSKREEAKQEGNDEIDDYEMLCIRGGSPPSQPKFEEHSNNMPSYSSAQQYPQTYYESDESGSSYNSWDSTEYRKEKRHNKHKGKERKSHKNRDGMGRDKRRHRNDSEGDDYKQDKAMGQRRLELCKFYLMECCAKREKCLYMHGDFPCKYYYLGMECVYKSACKFSHGDPLTDELKNILLKHIETAPKEILGNFRRISRESAISMLNQTHAKLCAEKGVINAYSNSPLPPIEINESPVNSPSHKSSNNNPFSNPNNSGIPSLLDMVINPPNISPRKEDKDRHKTEKPRKSRWCDNMNSPTTKNQKPPGSNGNQISNIPSPGATRNASTASNSATSILSLQNLSGVLSSEQIEKLTAIGVETLEQINNLTVAQLNELGLSISQIHEIQLNALNIQKLGLINQNTTSTSTFATTNTITTTSTTTAPSSTDVKPEISSPTESEPPLDLSNVQDIDMRRISEGFGSSKDTPSKSEPSESLEKLNVNELTAAEAGIASPDPVPLSGKPFTEEKEKDDDVLSQEQMKITYASTEIVDFSQYLKDAHLDVDKDLNLNNLLDKDDVLNEDEPALQIDESWCPSDDDTTKHDASRDSDEEPSMYWENTTDTDTKPETDSEKTTDTPKPISYDPKSFLPQSMYSTAETSKTSSDSIGDDNDNNSKDIETKPPIVDMKFLSSLSYDPKSFISPSICSMIDASIKKEENKEEEEKKDIPPKIEPQLDDILYPKPITYDAQALLAPSVSKKVEIKPILTDKWDEEEISSIEVDQRESKSSEPAKEEEETKRANPFKQSRKPNPFGNPTKFNPFRNDPRLNSYLHKRKSNDDDENWDDKDSPKMSSPHPNEQKEADKKAEEPAKKTDELNPVYNRTSIYDGSSIDNDEESKSKKADKDMRMSLFLGQFSDSTTSDIDLRLPFKPAMINYTPATEIDGSIGSHAPIPYKIVEVEIPKPDYSEIRRSIPVTDKTLDPRLRRIFCLKESIINAAAEGTEGDGKPSTETKVIPSGPRLDPRRKKDETSTVGVSTAMQVTSDSKSGQNVNLHVLLQKSEWYKNLSSKNKIMVNQQLAMLSSEIKKFNADQSPNKIFDLSVLATNPNLQQILENLGVYVDANANIKQVSDMEQDNESNAQANNMLGLMNMFDNPQNVGGQPIPMDLLMGARQINQLNRHFMGGNPLPFGNMFNDVKPGLLGIAPGIQFNPNELGFMANANFGKNDNMQGGMNSGGGHNNSGGGGGGNRNRNNFRQGNNRNSGNDRWSGNNSGSRNNNNRRNFDNRRNNRDNRRDKQSNS